MGTKVNFIDLIHSFYGDKSHTSDIFLSLLILSFKLNLFQIIRFNLFNDGHYRQCDYKNNKEKAIAA